MDAPCLISRHLRPYWLYNCCLQSRYVTAIASMYRNNPFHNFEHASHVTMSVTKLLSRIVAPDSLDANVGTTMHDYAYGITSCSLTQFACVFAALIHDVDHPGIPNSELRKENAKLTDYYQGRCIAEQNSIDISWTLLMDSKFNCLRRAIYRNESEKQLFRSLVVNSVMATDLFDPQLKRIRDERWEKAFASSYVVAGKESADRKATIVIEHLIQASDVCHTMQHWHIYRKWNARLFQEMYAAYSCGVSKKDPSEFWYEEEMQFFDSYVIPTAKKLKDCGVFGVSSDELLSYAIKNRQEWEDRGHELVAEMLKSAQIPTLLEI
jgi:hypothetical protein